MIYFDNSATTMPCKESIEALCEALREDWGNPSSTHFAGVAARKTLDEARRRVASSLGIKRMTDGKIIFTSGGTEANSLALLGCIGSKDRPYRGKYRGSVIISDGEHASVESSCRRLEEDGFRVYRIPTKGGALDLEDLAKCVTDDVVIASIMLVNNETGAIYDVKRAFDIIKEASPACVCHSDCVQAYLKMKAAPLDIGADMISVSAHKIFSSKGAGALYVSNEIIKTKKISPRVYGGGQEDGYRSGTENVPAITAFGAAAAAGAAELSSRIAVLRDLAEYAEMRIGVLDGVRLNLPEKRLASILSITLPGIKSEVMLNYLSGKGICVSKSSACSARSKSLSPALAAFGLPDAEIDCSLRVSFSHLNTRDEVDAFCDVLERGIKTLAKVRR
ncbi:MAG: cysteine desulfurase [Clostridia bacterium]|nr:cysteine desulfurase [Clostridia bacterium]